VGGSVSIGVGVSFGASVDVGMNAVVSIALGSGNGEFVAPKVAVTTRITGEGQLHWFFGSGVSVGVNVIVAVGDAVGVMLGVKVGVFVFNSTNVGNSGPPVSEI